MVRITGAAFIMGCKSGRDTDCNDSEKPAHEVRLRDFYIGRYEVTQAQWRAVMGIDPPLLYNKGCDQCPVERVSWDDIQTFLKKLNILTGKRYRLPTEAEWEYAARGGNLSKGYLYSGSNTMGEVAWYDANAKLGNTNGAQKTTRPVGTKKPNELGCMI
jgi:formylglycine-generating enzyme